MKDSLNYSLRPSVPLNKKRQKFLEKMFANMVLVATGRNLDMREVLKHPSGPLLWALFNCDCTLK